MRKNSDNSGQHKKAFLAAFAECGSVTHAAKAAKTRRQSHYEWYEEDSAYRDEFHNAKETAADNLEREARRRAIEGVLEPVFYKGAKCGAIRKYSDTLLICLLNANRPEKFKQRHTVEHGGPKGGPIQVTVTVGEVVEQVKNEPEYLEFLRQQRAGMSHLNNGNGHAQSP